MNNKIKFIYGDTDSIIIENTDKNKKMVPYYISLKNKDGTDGNMHMVKNHRRIK